MLKKFFLLLIVAMLNVVALWAADVVQITPPTDESSYKDEQYISTVGSTKFFEPTVRVWDNSESKDVTGKYNISYSLKSNGVVGTAGYDDRGVAIVTDNGSGSLNTGTTVETYYGNVKMGSAGDVTIIVTATPKAGGDALASVEYTIHISSLPATPTFVPSYAAAIAPSTDGRIVVTSVVKTAEAWDHSTTYYIPSGKSVLPKLVVKTENAGGIESDITDHFDVSIAFKSNGEVYAGDKVSYANGAITYNGFGNQYQVHASTDIDTEKSALEALNLTLEYTIEPKTAYAGQYRSFKKTIDVIVDVADENTKRDLALELTKDCFSNATVDAYIQDDKAGYKITVYKYPSSNSKYKVPVPALKTTDGAIISMGKSGDPFEPVFVIEDDQTYFDDCSYMYSNRTGSIQAAGEPTGIMILNPTFQVGKPGLVRVAMYGGVTTNNGGLAELEQIYNSKGTVTNKTGTGNQTEYRVFTDPVYFYIDVLKRNPSIELTPNPSEMFFLKDREITMDERFEISASIDSSHDGESGSLVWGANDGYSDHFAYQFFISDRMQKSYLKIDWYAYQYSGDAHDPNPEDETDTHPIWTEKGGDQYSYIDWHKTGYTNTDAIKIQAGDIIKTGTVTFTADRDFTVNTEGSATDRNLMGQAVTIGDESILITPGNISKLVGVKSGDVVTVDTYVLVTDANIDGYLQYEEDGVTVKTGDGLHPYLNTGDYEKGITYNSMKQYGNENWTMTFLADGTYTIPYTVRPWNHVKWDNSDEIPVKFVIKEHIPTELLLSYYFQIATKGQTPFDEPTKKVIVPSEGNLDITSDSSFSYEMTDGFSLVGTTYTHTSTGTTLDATTGEVTIGSLATGDVHIKVNVTATKSGYDLPTSKVYTIRIVDGTGMATWEIISSCKTDPCGEYTGSGTQRFDFDDTSAHGELDQALGRMHFLTAGDIYGGTEIEGVPGISMTIGAPAADEHALADWITVATSEATPRCCSHETTPVIVRSKATVALDEDGIPTDGAFYQFNPTVNGYLTVDAKYYKDRTIVLITRSSDGVVVEEIFTNPGSGSEYTTGVKATFDGDGNLLGDYTFKRPLIAGETYYLYDRSYSMEFNVHGFRYEPAFIIDRSTTLTKSREPLSATTFMNSLSNSLPVLYNGSNSDVTFSVPTTHENDETISDYLELLGTDGALDPKQMTAKDDDIFKIRVTATVNSSKESTLGDCIRKTTYYDVSILDIPTYIIGARSEYDRLGEDYTPAPGKTVTTENISTDITMTFGGWNDTDGKYAAKGLSDEWQYKSAAGAASRIGSEGADDDPTYNKTIDGFNYFIAGLQNPINEENMGALQKGTEIKAGNDNSYSYGSGTDFETATDKYYNTTYRLPARGSFLKFEPRESGTLLVYLVQNGSCDYHYGLDDVAKTYQIKWRPLYITDETGKPVTMVNSFGNVSQYLPTGTDMANAGSFTLGISRCNKVEEEIANSFVGGDVIEGCSFDWTEFKGTAADREALLAAWPEKGQRESMVRLSNGGFSLPHKAYVRYTFEVKAGKTYFVFQPGSKFEFGGFSFVPTGFPNNCKYTVNSHPAVPSKSQNESIAYNATNQEKLWNNGAPIAGSDPGTDKTFTWAKAAGTFEEATSSVENLSVTINDRRNSELASDNTFIHRTFTADKWESLCLPFSVSESEMTRVFGENYVLLTCDGVNERERLHFIRHANRYVEAGRPYLIKPSQDVSQLTFNHVSIESTATVRNFADNADVKVTDRTRFDVNVNDEYTFHGTYYRETVKQNSFFVDTKYNAGDGIYKLTGGNGKLGGYRAFFQVKEKDVLSGNFLALEFEDYTPDGIDTDSGNPTSILIIDAKTGDIRTVNQTEGIYGINGQKYSNNPLDLNTAPSGIYIMDGHKYIK